MTAQKLEADVLPGPEEVPYELLGPYANAAAVAHDLDEHERLHYLIAKIPASELTTVSERTYARTARFADDPESPDYYGALESIAWADRIDRSLRDHRIFLGGLGVVTGGAVGAVADAAYLYQSSTASCSH